MRVSPSGRRLLDGKKALGEFASTGERGIITSSNDLGKQASEKSGMVHTVTFVFRLRSDPLDTTEFVHASMLASVLDSALESAVDFLTSFSPCLTPLGMFL